MKMLLLFLIVFQLVDDVAYIVAVVDTEFVYYEIKTQA